MWEQDKYLRGISSVIDSCKLISFDIFDTVLFRTVSSADKIFLHTGERLRELYPEYGFPAEVFAGMRTEAEDLARKNAWETAQHEDVRLDEIYREFRLGTEFQERAKECELETEARHLYLNRSIETLIRCCRDRGKLITMVSDTYFSEREIRKLLNGCGFDCSLVDYYIISSEFRALKHSGRLFRKLLDKASDINPGEILQIGDNRMTDIDGAAVAGIQAWHYGAIPRAALHPMAAEANAFGTVEAVASLRKFSCAFIPEECQENEDITLFEAGSTVFGPVYSAFAEWVIEQSQSAGINVVLVFMREGELLSRLISKAAINRGIDISVKTVFISRRTTEIVGIGAIDGRVIDEYVHRGKLSLADLFSIFYLDIYKTGFSEDRGCTVEQYKESGKFDGLMRYFADPATLAEINKRVGEQRALLIEYIQSLTGGNDAITVDVGFRGTMQACLTEIEANGEAGLLHLLMMGIPFNNRFLLKGVKIRGWLGYGCENNESVERVYRRIQMPEAVTNADCGTTLAYEKQDGRIIPILEDVNIDDEDKRKKKVIWSGIDCYQECWFLLLAEKPYLVKEVIADRKGMFGILSRLLLMPTREEASALGGLYYDESILNSEKSKVIKAVDYTFYDMSGDIEMFIESCLMEKFKERVYWPEGVAAVRNPAYFLDRYLKSTASPIHIKAREFLSDAGITGKRIAVYGAGAVGRELVGVFCDLGVQICCIVDNDTALQGRSFYGVSVVSPQESVGKADVYIVTPLRFEEEIRSLLQQLLHDVSGDSEIITYS